MLLLAGFTGHIIGRDLTETPSTNCKHCQCSSASAFEPHTFPTTDWVEGKELPWEYTLLKASSAPKIV